MSTVLVTGAAGFIGGYLIRELVSNGYDVVGLDNFSKYGPVSQELRDHPRYQFVEGDARDVELLVRLLADADHFVAGAAMIGGVAYMNAYPYDLLATNERIMAAACDSAIKVRKAGRLKKVTYIGSSMVYSSADFWPYKEGDELRIAPPATAYGFQKLAVEYYARSAWAQYGLPYTILRIFNCVGVGDLPAVHQAAASSGNIKLAMSHVVPDLVRKVLLGQDPLHLIGDGEQVRHFTYARDLVRGIRISLEHPAAQNEDFNLSSAESTTVRRLAELIWRRVKGPGAPFRYLTDEPFPDDVQNRIPDVTKAREVLGFQATTSLDAMLDEVISWVRQAVDQGRLRL